MGGGLQCITHSLRQNHGSSRSFGMRKRCESGSKSAGRGMMVRGRSVKRSPTTTLKTVSEVGQKSDVMTPTGWRDGGKVLRYKWNLHRTLGNIHVAEFQKKCMI